jgi:dipeptidyl aminopeptidase/acylaminoacyl peptidase
MRFAVFAERVARSHHDNRQLNCSMGRADRRSRRRESSAVMGGPTIPGSARRLRPGSVPGNEEHSVRNESHRVVGLLIASLVLLAAACTAVAQQKRIDVETIIDLNRVGGAVIHPDGMLVAYELTVPEPPEDDEKAGRTTSIWLMLLDGEGEARRFTPERVSSSSPAFSPDGSMLAFLSKRSDRHEKTQIYLIPLDGGEARMLTDHETDVGSFRFSPDGSTIAFSARAPETDEEKQAEKEGRDWIIVGEDYDDASLWTVDVATGEISRVFDEKINVLDFEWTPDGQTLIVRASPTPFADDRLMYPSLYRAAAAGGDPQKLFPTEGKLGDFEVSPDGSTLAFLGAVDITDPLAQSVFIAPLDGSAPPRDVTPGLEASISQLAWLNDGVLIVRASEGTRATMSTIDIATGERTIIVDPGCSIWSFDLHRASGRFVAIADGLDYPGELHAGSVETGQLTRLTNSNPQLADYAIARSVAIQYRAQDDQEIGAVLTYPIDYDPSRVYPMIVNPHGGPEGANRVGFDTIAQLLAAHGYLVFQPNYRGSAGRGVAWAKGDHYDLGGQEFRDVIAGIETLIERGIADRDRIGIGGWSYGGYFSALGATLYSEFFKAAVMGAGISNWISFTGTTDIPHENSYVHWNQWMYEDFDRYWDASPLSAIDKANTPTLILHGQDDERVPVEQGIELYRALEDKGVETQMVIYPRAGHGVRERAHRIDLLTRELEWFDRFLKGDGVASGDGEN